MIGSGVTGTGAGGAQETTAAGPGAAARAARALSFGNISAVYVLVIVFAIFALWIPGTFLTASIWRTLLENGALTAMLAVGLVLPMAAGCFDLAIGTEVGFSGILVAWLLVRDVPIVPAIVVTVAVGALIGLCSALLVVKARMDSFIATMGVSSVLIALTEWVSGSQQILNLNPSFQRLAVGELFGITYPVYVMVVLGAGVWYVLERTPTGRRLYATGGNGVAARLAGVRTSLVIICSLVACGAIAAVVGVTESSQLATGDPTVGPSYLLPAFAAVFLGSTQFHEGRYNVAGTVLSVYVLAVGVKGLQLAGAPVWLPDLFNGLALLVAVGLTRYKAFPSRRRTPGDTRGRQRSQPLQDVSASDSVDDNQCDDPGGDVWVLDDAASAPLPGRASPPSRASLAGSRRARVPAPVTYPPSVWGLRVHPWPGNAVDMRHCSRDCRRSGRSRTPFDI